MQERYNGRKKGGDEMKQWEYFERMVVKAKSGRVEKGEIGRKDQFNYAEAEKTRNFHRSFPEYSPTP